MKDALLRRILFRMDPETAHNLSISLLEGLGRMPRTSERLWPTPENSDPVLSQDLWGLHFSNPLGLAAGYDKDARAAAALSRMGFGFIELGTITPRPQNGNPRPRLFRYPAEEAVINRMGFPGEGARAAARRLSALGTLGIPVGINIGKNRDTPLESAADDYLEAMEILFPHAGYFAINVSSPNTPGLRGLQDCEQLLPLLQKIGQTHALLSSRHGGVRRPLLLKIAPDLPPGEITALGKTALENTGLLDGFIATNTTTTRPPSWPVTGEAGGLSGRPLAGLSTRTIARLHLAVQGKIPIVGVGGIFGAEDAYQKILAGASLVQVYTGWVYRGTELVGEIVSGMATRLREDGHSSLQSAVGQKAAQFAAAGRTGTPDAR